MRCKVCKKVIEKNAPTCDWRQGRCPHRGIVFNEIVLDTYKMRVYNMFEMIKGWFK